MNITKAYASGFKTTVRSLKMTLVIYILNLLMGLTIAIPFMGALKEASGHSMAPQNLLKGFDFTSFQEILRHYGEEISSYLSHGFWMVLFFLILSIFLTGGILTAFKQKKSKFSLGSFFSGCGTFFFRFFKISLYTVFMHIILAVFIYLIFAFIVAGMAGGTASEKTFFYLFYLYMIVSRTIGMTSGITILFMFVLQQLFIWLRISLRIWTFASQFDYYSAYYKQTDTN